MAIHGGTHREKGCFDFSASTSPLGMHPAAQAALAFFSLNPEEGSEYPDTESLFLRQKLGKFWNFPAENIVCSSGAADLIYAVTEVFTKNPSAGKIRSDSAFVLEPAFSEYEEAVKKTCGGTCIKIFTNENDGFLFSEKSLEGLDVAAKECSLFFAASPSNPAGTLLSFDDIQKIENFCKRNGLIFVLDSCFAQFSDTAEKTLRMIIDRKDCFKNLIILNAFTKFYGLAGLRLGYALCFSKNVADSLFGYMRPWAVSSVAQVCGCRIIDSELGEAYPAPMPLQSASSDWGEKVRSSVLSEVQKFYDFFDSVSVKYVRGRANYVLFYVQNAEAFDSFLKNHNCFLRRCEDFAGLGENWFRLSIKAPKDNDFLLELFANFWFANFWKKTIHKEASGDSSCKKKRRAVPIMIQGTMSNAGKTLLVAALCRILKNDGFKVAPFKSQNMALNSGVTTDGLEMGRAQILQAFAAGIEPDVRMNPILLKPTGDSTSQVIVNGEVYATMSAADYFSYRKNLIPFIKDAYNSLADEFDVIVIEGAGSPAEINLRKDDIVNMGLAELVDSPVILAGDIDRGGVFASLYGTAALVSDSERNRIKGFIINKFRGDVKLLENGLSMIHSLTGIPVLGVVPYIDGLNLDDEDSLSSVLSNSSDSAGVEKLVNVFVVKLPYISNFTDLNAFVRIPFVRVSFFSSLLELESLRQQFGEADLLILPGTKNTIKALDFLYDTKILQWLRGYAEKNPVIGICGGYQLLGETLFDLDGSEGGVPNSKREGCALLPLETVFTNEKLRTVVNGILPRIEGFFSDLSALPVHGYEIHAGRSSASGLVTARNFVLGTYVHGFFDSPAICEGILRLLAQRKGIELPDFSSCRLEQQEKQESSFKRLEQVVRESIDMKALYKIIGLQQKQGGE